MVAAIKLTVDHLEALPEDGKRYELIDGELLVSKAPGIIHQRPLGRLFYRLIDFLNDNPIGEVILGPGVVFSSYDAVIPDLVFVASGRAHIVTDRGLIDAPDLLIEIVSPGALNSERDREIKRQLYTQRGLREYWVVDPQLKVIEVYLLQDNVLQLYATLRDSDILSSKLLPGFTCVVSEIFA